MHTTNNPFKRREYQFFSKINCVTKVDAIIKTEETTAKVVKQYGIEIIKQKLHDNSLV
jgi:hypothetical protein